MFRDALSPMETSSVGIGFFPCRSQGVESFVEGQVACLFTMVLLVRRSAPDV